jgi:hypothetical protein
MASAFILLFMAAVLLVDYATFRRSAVRLLVLEFLVFAAGGLFVVFPGLAIYCANLVGIGRGVDFIMYPIVIWLVREVFVSRHRQWQETARLAELVRALAMRSAVPVGRPSPNASIVESPRPVD